MQHHLLTKSGLMFDKWWASDVIPENARKKFISIYSNNPKANLGNFEKILYFKE